MPIIIKCIRGSGDTEAPSINDALITTEHDAVKRGKRWLDDNYYLIKKRSLKVPHKASTVVPGRWITVSDGKLGMTNKKLKIKSYTITITPKSVWASIDTEEYLEFEMP